MLDTTSKKQRNLSSFEPVEDTLRRLSTELKLEDAVTSVMRRAASEIDYLRQQLSRAESRILMIERYND